jgi:hypothetical protein
MTDDHILLTHDGLFALPSGYRMVQYLTTDRGPIYRTTTDDIPNPRWVGRERATEGEAIADTCEHSKIEQACFSREVNTYIGTVLTRWGHVKLIQFAGPDDAGPDRRCIKIGDDARFTRSDARDLVRQLEDWLASRNKV